MTYDPSYLDPHTRPQDDFHQYAVGGYLAVRPIPADRASWGITEEMEERNAHLLRDILETTEPGAAGSNEQKLHDFYASGMDQAAIDAAGLLPLQPEFDRIDAIETAEQLQAVVAHLHRRGIPVVFSVESAADPGNPDMSIGEAFQGGLGLPDRDYYLDDDLADIRAAYQEHVGTMLYLAGQTGVRAARPPMKRAFHGRAGRPHPGGRLAEAVMRVETRLAKSSMDKVALREPQAIYNMHDLQQLSSLTPHFDWRGYLAAIGLPGVQRINVATPSFFRDLDGALAEVPLEDWKTYLRWQVLNETAPYLSQPFETENFNFHGRVLTGVDTQLPRWHRIVSDVDDNLGDALAQKYVERAFPPAARVAAVQLVESIRDAARDAIVENLWMTESTRAMALKKLDAMVLKIGYPDRWKDYSTLDVSRGPYVENVLRAWEFDVRDDLAKIGQPVDRMEWAMTAPKVNAYYDITANEFVFPAGILQPPLFDMHADLAANMGATGVTVGHELTHAFDDEGAQYDATGRLHNWWTPDDLAHFEAIGDGVARQMSEFHFEDVHQDGDLVKGESIADLGGLELAWRAFKKLSASVPRGAGGPPAHEMGVPDVLRGAGGPPAHEMRVPDVLRGAGGPPAHEMGVPDVLRGAGGPPAHEMRVPDVLRGAGGPPAHEMRVPDVLRGAGGPPAHEMGVPDVLRGAGGPPAHEMRVPDVLRGAGGPPAHEMRVPDVLRGAGGPPAHEMRVPWAGEPPALRGTQDGFTADQRFFLNYALSWATHQRQAFAHLKLTTDEHPLPAFRVNGPLANMPAFWQAFNVQPGDALRRKDRNHVWDP